MEKNKKELKILSILILALTALSLVNIIVGLCANGLPKSEPVPEGMTEEIIQIVSMRYRMLLLQDPRSRPHQNSS